MLIRIKQSSLVLGCLLAILMIFFTANRALSITDAGSEMFFVELERSIMEGYGWTPDGQVQIEVYDSPGGTLIAGPVIVQTDSVGEFVAPDIILNAPGMFIRVTDQTTHIVKELTVQLIEITSIDFQNDLVNGIAPPNVFVQALIEDPPGNWVWGIGSYSDDSGIFSVSFSGILDIQLDHIAEANYTDDDRDMVGSAPNSITTFHLQGGYDSDWMEFYYYSPANTIEYQVLDDQGNILSSGTTPTNAKGWGYIDFDDHGVELQPGYQIVGLDQKRNFSTTITMQNIRTTVADYALDYVAGTAPPDIDLKIMVGTEAGGAESIFHFDIHSDANGNWSSYLLDEFGYDLTYDKWIYAELDDEYRNTTFAALDEDADDVANWLDNAKLTFNPDQSDLDIDEVGDVEDPCPNNLENLCNPDRSGAISIDQLGGVLTTSEGDTSVNVPADSLLTDTSISVTDTGESYLLASQASTNDRNFTLLWTIFSNFIGPTTVYIATPMSITFSWDDANNDGYVDLINVAEENLYVVHNGVQLTNRCQFDTGCDLVNNRFTFTTSSLGDFALVGEKTGFVVYLPSLNR